MQTAAEAERAEVLARAQATARRATGEAEAAGEAARVAAYAAASPELLLALAARELAQNLPSIGSLTLSPDLLSPVLARLAGGGQQR